MAKLLSGRWIMTVACAAVFITCSLQHIFTPDIIERIITIVVVFYFMKKSDDKVVK